LLPYFASLYRVELARIVSFARDRS